MGDTNGVPIMAGQCSIAGRPLADFPPCLRRDARGVPLTFPPSGRGCIFARHVHAYRPMMQRLQLRSLIRARRRRACRARRARAFALHLLALALAAATPHASGRAQSAAAQSVRAPDTVFLEELTWTEVRDLQRDGKTTVIIATAGTEQKGPHMVTGEHKYVITHAAEQIARRMGNALVAPVLTYVPEGSWDPPLRGHMAKAGSITLPQERFVEVLVHAGESLRAGGFSTVILIGDSGGNQEGLKLAAERLNASWLEQGPQALFISDYYAKSVEDMQRYLTTLGYSRQDIGAHAGMLDTSELLFVNPALVRRDRLAPGGGFPDSGVSGDPTKASAELGKALVQIKVDNAVAQIRALLAGGGSR
jgi:creatinine amidohydrolase